MTLHLPVSTTHYIGLLHIYTSWVICSCLHFLTFLSLLLSFQSIILIWIVNNFLLLKTILLKAVNGFHIARPRRYSCFYFMWPPSGFRKLVLLCHWNTVLLRLSWPSSFLLPILLPGLLLLSLLFKVFLIFSTSRFLDLALDLPLSKFSH